MIRIKLIIAAAALLVLVIARANADNPPHPIVGVWELAPELMGDDPYALKLIKEGVKLVYEFTAEGKANISIFSKGMTLTMAGSYQLLNEDTLRLELAPKGKRPKAAQTVKYKVQGDRLELLDQKGQFLIFTRK